MSAPNLTVATGTAKAGTVASPTRRIRWLHGSRDPLSLALARRLGIRASTAEHLIRKTPRLMAAIIRVFQEAGAEKRLAALLEDVERAKEGREPPPDCDATWSLADIADGKEDLAQHRYERDPSVKTRAAYIAALREDRRYITALLDMLIDEQDRAERQS